MLEINALSLNDKRAFLYVGVNGTYIFTQYTYRYQLNGTKKENSNDQRRDSN